jgi:hypothetical protein
MHSLNRKKIATSLILALVGVGGAGVLVIACGGGGATISGGDDASSDSTAASDTSSTQNNDANPGVDSGPKDSGSTDTGTSNLDAGTDANLRTVNPDGGCDPVQDGEIFVDPTNGSDTATTPGGYVGQAYSAACAFKTIGAALTYAGATPAAGTKIFVVGTATVQAGETFPIVVPANVEIRGVGSGAVTIIPTTNTSAFTMNAHPSLLTNLTISGGASSASGVVVDTGSSVETVLTDVSISAFTNGIIVQNTGIATIAAGAGGVKLMGNSGSGLLLTKTAKADLTAASTSGGIHISTNAIGIDVQDTAVLNAVGVAGPSNGTGSIVASLNTAQGIFIEGSTGANVLTGVVAYNNTGDGIAVVDSSTVVVRSSQTIKNGANGFHVQKGAAAITPTNPANIDLGKAKDGKNVLNVGAGSQNTLSGLCFDTDPIAAKQTLSAQGNTFSGMDCSANADHPSHSTCTGGVDVGLGNTNNAVDITMCTLN